MMDDFSDFAEGLLNEDYSKAQAKLEEQKLKNQNLLQSYARLAQTMDGRVVLWDILERCHIFANAFTGNSRTFFLTGEQSIGQYVLKMLQIGESLEAFDKIKALKPQQERKKQ
jgi:hypothetical protein